MASQLSSGVTQIFSTVESFAALKADGSVVAWGYSLYGGDTSAVASQLSYGVSDIFSTDGAFAALKADGSVVTWGDSSWGGDSSAVAALLGSGVTQIFSTGYAFAALKADGSVVTWGDPSSGGDSLAVEIKLSSGITQIFSAREAFAALKADGSVVTWGSSLYGGDSSAVSSNLSSGVTQIFSNSLAFAALKADGSVVTWGGSLDGGDSSAVASQLSSGVSNIFSNNGAFAALKADGSVVTWGGTDSGGDSSQVASQLTNVVAFANPFTDDRLVGSDIALPTITLALSPASVTEDGANNLVYTFSRTGVTTSALAVNYTVAGTATLGTDYTGILGTGTTKEVIFSAGSAAATVTVNPIADITIEANETVVLTLADGTGYTRSLTTTVTGTITNDDSPPLATAAITGLTDNAGIVQGTVAEAARTNDTTPAITGTLSAALVSGESVRIFNGATLLGTAAVNNTALTWTYTPTLPATAGITYSITARVADAAGNLGTASAARTFVLDTTAPVTTAAITDISDNVGIISGSVAAGGRTNDPTPTITGTLSAALVSGESVRIFNGATLLGTAAVNNTALTWTYTPTLPATAGITYSITARVADAAGNLGTASAARTFVLDTTAPVTTAAITDISDNVGIISGSVAAGGRTNDPTPTITGTLSAALVSGESVRIFNGATLLGTAAVNNTALTWTYTPTLPATAGITYSITARVADAAGNLGTASAARTFVLDTTAPVTTAAITDISDNVGIISGSVAAGGRTNDPTPTITGTLSAALVSGESVRIFNGATLLGTAAVNNTALTWTYTPTLPATAGITYSITARVADAAGNLGTASAARTFVLDTTAPVTTAAITDISDNVGIISGSVAAGGRTNDPTPTITGTLSAALVSGESVRIFNGATLLGTAAVNNTALTWTYTPTLPATAGITYSITARVADAAGNLGTASAARTFVLDTTAPVTTAAITDISDNVGIISGSVAAGGRTNDPTPTITGTLSAAVTFRKDVTPWLPFRRPEPRVAPESVPDLLLAC